MYRSLLGMDLQIVLSTNGNIWGPNKPQREILSNEACAELKEACRSKGDSDCRRPPPFRRQEVLPDGDDNPPPEQRDLRRPPGPFPPRGAGGGLQVLSIQYREYSTPFWFTKHTRGCKLFIPSHTGGILFERGVCSFSSHLLLQEMGPPTVCSVFRTSRDANKFSSAGAVFLKKEKQCIFVRFF